MDPNSSNRLHHLTLLFLLLIGLGVSCVIEISAIRANGGPGFPLDDPWIHLQFARNLHDYGSYSYYKNLMVTSGSTSPFYTFLLAAGFFLTGNEMVLSYVLGVSFLLLGAAYLFMLARLIWDKHPLFAPVAAALYLIEPRLQWGSLSGMETTLFICLLLAVWYYYRVRKPVALGITAGLLLWTRPEALLFLLVLAADLVYQSAWKNPAANFTRAARESLRNAAWLRPALFIFLAFGAGYLLFNELLSGSVFPNTYAAKLKYYGGGKTNFPAQVFHFLADGHMVVIAVFAAMGIVAVFRRAVRRGENPLLVPLLWSAAMFFAYWRDLPYLYQQGRYLMPILPFIVLLGVDGVRWLSEILGTSAARRKRWATALPPAVLLIMVVQFAVGAYGTIPAYANQCRYISDRQVRTARWIRTHLPESAVIGTHDIGAIAFYSERRVADMVGLVSPEMIASIGQYDKLYQFLAGQGVTDLAVLRNWFNVADQDPLFQTNENEPEIMEVFAYEPGRTHFATAEEGRLEEVAAYYLSAGYVRDVAQGLQQYLKAKPGTARLHNLLGRAYLADGELQLAAGQFEAAEARCPHSRDAEIGLAKIAEKKGDVPQAIGRMQQVIGENPYFIPAYQDLALAYAGLLRDTVKANETLKRLTEYESWERDSQ